jgi:hypothetical protein
MFQKFNRTHTSVFAAVALFAAGAAVPAAAAEPKASVSTASESEMPTLNADKRRFCVRTDTTGTRISKMVCKTRREWSRFGFDPLNAK